jgi:hypothetical protein
MTASLAALLIVVAAVVMVGVVAEIDWRYRQRKKPVMLLEPSSAAAEHEAMREAVISLST